MQFLSFPILRLGLCCSLTCLSRKCEKNFRFRVYFFSKSWDIFASTPPSGIFRKFKCWLTDGVHAGKKFQKHKQRNEKNMFLFQRKLIRRVAHYPRLGNFASAKFDVISVNFFFNEPRHSRHGLRCGQPVRSSAK